MAEVPHEKGGEQEVIAVGQHPPERWTSQFTTELLELLWVLETTVAAYPDQATLLEAVISGDCFQSDELPQVPEEIRMPPKVQAPDSLMLDF